MAEPKPAVVAVGGSPVAAGVPRPGPLPASFDEVALSSPEAAERFRQLTEELGKSGSTNLSRVSVQSRRLMRDLGVTFNLYREDAAAENILPFDPFPRVLDRASWEFLARGLEQRVRIWNEFFRDIYDSQEVLKSGIVPFEIVYDDPRYQRNAVGLKVPEDVFVHVAAFDLARDREGRWVVIEDYVGNTTGVTYALSARNVLSQAAPDLLERADLEPVHTYSTELLEHLRRFAHGSPEPRVVLLSPGVYNSAYYEHSSLARQMGIPLVRGSDLIVLNSRCYLKTIGGLEPIDVIYRRVDESFIDPVAFRNDSQLGVPGLLTCVRKGTVTVANAAGTGLGDNRAIATYLPKLARFYARETLLIPTVERRLCFDADQRELVASDLENHIVQHISERSADAVWDPASLNAEALAALRRKMDADPARYIAEPRLPLTTLPTWSGDALVPRHAGLRCFVFGGRKPRVFPLALTRFAPQAGSRTISSGLGGGIKDTWILRGTTATATPETPIIVASPQRRLRLGSRIADSLFWMGRYKARIENTTRILKVVQQVQLENPAQQRAQSWAALWEALARTTGHDTHFFKRSPLLRQQSVSQYLLLDRKNPASVLNNVARLRENARVTRESVPPEVWAVINRLWQTIDSAAGGEPLNDDHALPRIQDLEQRILDDVDALSGCAAKNMLRDDAWHFWTLGRHVERAVTATLVTRQVLLKRADPTILATAGDSNLDALLRMLACQYAYRSLYQTRPTAENVVSLVLQDAALPRSVLHCVESIRDSLERVSGPEVRRRDAPSPLRTSAHLAGEVEFADLSTLFHSSSDGSRPQPLFLDAWLEDLATRLTRLAVEISDHHLYHQAFNILR